VCVQVWLSVPLQSTACKYYSTEWSIMCHEGSKLNTHTLTRYSLCLIEMMLISYFATVHVSTNS